MHETAGVVGRRLTNCAGLVAALALLAACGGGGGAGGGGPVAPVIIESPEYF